MDLHDEIAAGASQHRPGWIDVQVVDDRGMSGKTQEEFAFESPRYEAATSTATNADRQIRVNSKGFHGAVMHAKPVLDGTIGADLHNFAAVAGDEGIAFITGVACDADRIDRALAQELFMQHLQTRRSAPEQMQAMVVCSGCDALR